MNFNRKTLTAALAALSLLFLAVPAVAGPLNGHPLAFDDGGTNGGHGAAWTGSTSYNSFGVFTGFVDWAVFTEANFNTAFPGSTYSPPAGELVYVYQITNTGSLAANSLSVGVTPGNAVGTIGEFSDGGVTGTPVVNSQFLNNPVDSANWSFLGAAIPSGGGVSEGLAYSSTNLPENGFGTMQDGGISASVIPLPTPSSVAIPEPATALLAGFGLALMFNRRRS